MTLRERIAWLVIIGLTAFVVYYNARSSRTSANEENLLLSDLVIKLRAQEALEFKLLQSRMDPRIASTWSVSIDRLIAQMASDARAPEDELRVAIVAGDLQGRDQALARLDRLSGTRISAELANDVHALRTIYSGGPAALDSASQSRLIGRYDYFGRLALAYGVASNTEPRKSIEQSAISTTMVLGIVAAAFLLLMVLSLVLLIAAIVLLVKGQIQWLYVPEPSANTAFLEVFALYLVLFFVLFGLVRRAFGWTNLNWEWLAWLIIPIVMTWSVRQGITIDKCRMALGWHRGRGWVREIVAGLAGYLAGLIFLALGLVITALLIKLTNASPRNWLTPMLSGNAWHVLALYGLVCVFAPVIEETMFRGALFHYLRGRWNWMISAAVVTSIFALMHPQGWVAFPALGAIAMVLAALREWRGSIIAPMVAHAFNNFIVLTLALSLLR